MYGLLDRCLCKIISKARLVFGCCLGRYMHKQEKNGENSSAHICGRAVFLLIKIRCCHFVSSVIKYI